MKKKYRIYNVTIRKVRVN